MFFLFFFFFFFVSFFIFFYFFYQLDELEWKKIEKKGIEHIRKGYNMDPGGKRFSIVEEAYFERAASIHPLNVDANLTYGVLLFEVRKDATNVNIAKN